MSTNVYIGARYVPIFDGDWNSTKVYEPLTIVNYNGGSYTSKRAVPANTAPTNTEYWALTGNYNGQIADLQNRMNNAEAAITEINGRPRYIFIGDSYAVGTNAGTQYGWFAQVETILGLTEGTDVFSYGAGGYGFIGNTGTFLSLLNQAINDITDKNNITNIFVAGGFNDIGDSGVDTAIKTFCDTARSNFPKAKITIAFNAAYDNRTIQIPISANAFRSTKEAYSHNNSGAELIPDLYSCLFSNNYIGSDGIHPTQTGYLLLGRQTANCIMGGFSNDFPLVITTFTPANGITQATGQQFYYKRTKTNFFVWFFYLYLTGDFGSGDTNNFIKIGTIDCNFPNVSEQIMAVPIICSIVTNDNLRHNCTAVAYINTIGEVYIRLALSKPNTNERYNYSEITLINSISPMLEFTIDANCI